MKKAFNVIVFILAFAGIIYGVHGIIKNIANAYTTPSMPTSTAPTSTTTEAEIVDCAVITTDYEYNELAADKQWKNKKVIVWGTAIEVDTSIFGSEYYLNFGTGATYSWANVSAYGISKDTLAEIKKGDFVAVQGTISDGGDLGITMKNCEVVQLGSIGAISDKIAEEKIAYQQTLEPVILDGRADEYVAGVDFPYGLYNIEAMDGQLMIIIYNAGETVSEYMSEKSNPYLDFKQKLENVDIRCGAKIMLSSMENASVQLVPMTN
ncbi:hypothetical protein FACS1894111_01570 [Clostridia bacterium]|nr:hypothetical protein FACS1894111_01570 [Clostridia bacterium]